MECGGMDSGVLPVDRLENEVEMEDSLDRSWRTSISSSIRRFRLRDVRGAWEVLMDGREAAADLRFGVEIEDEDKDVRFLMLVLFESSEAVVDRVCRIGGELFLLFCFITL